MDIFTNILVMMFSDRYIYRYLGNHVQRWIFTDILVMMFSDGYIYPYIDNDVQ